MFVKVVDCLGETNDKYFTCEIGPENVTKVITDNAKNCHSAGLLIKGLYPNIVWTTCVVHSLNLTLQNVCAEFFFESNQVTYEECCWITSWRMFCSS